MINDSKAGLGSRSEFPSKLLVVDMPGRFDEQEGGGWLQSIGSFVEEWARCRHFVNYGKGEQEIDDPLQSVKPHRVWRNHARIDTPGKRYGDWVTVMRRSRCLSTAGQGPVT
jgi:hypothetical protein